nr:unnamed protein product [Callosobruchus analis]
MTTYFGPVIIPVPYMQPRKMCLQP